MTRTQVTWLIVGVVALLVVFSWIALRKQAKLNEQESATGRSAYSARELTDKLIGKMNQEKTVTVVL